MTQATISFDPPHNGTETSRQAAESIKPRVGPDCRRILNLLAECQYSGATCDEIEIALKMRHQTASARLRDLAGPKVAAIYHHGTRKTKSGRPARVYFLRATP